MLENTIMNDFEFEMPKSKVYIKVNENNYITAIDGGYTIGNIKNFDEWIFIDEGNGDRYNLCQSNYLDKLITDEQGFYNYKYIDGEIVETPDSEKVIVLTPEEQREQAYRTDPIIEWQGEMITVDKANDLWLKYSAEGSEIANELSALIVIAKSSIRQLYTNVE